MLTSKTNNIFRDKELAVTSAFILLCLVLFLFFPSQGSFQKLSKGLFFLVAVPSLYIKFILKKTLRSFGLNADNMRAGLIWSFFMLLASFVIFYLAFTFTDFRSTYGLPEYLTSNFWLFLTYELLLVNFLLFIYIYFFQGFVLFYLSQKLSYWSILIQSALFASIFFLSNSLNWQSFPLLILSLIGGIATYKTRSFIYAYITSLIILLALDSYLIYTLK